MKLNAIYALSLVLVGLLSTADGVVTTAKKAAVKPAATTAAAKAAATKAATTSKAPAKAAVPISNTTNGEGLPNGSPSDTGCIDGCNVYPPPATDGNTANSLEIYYLAWFPSFKAGQSLNMSFWTAYNPSASAATVPTSLNIDLYDQFGKVSLGNIATGVAVKAPSANTPFVINSWKIPTSVTANFNVSNQFMVVFTGANNYRRDRLIQIDGITASPGGGLNPAYSNAVTGQIPVTSGIAPTNNTNTPGTTITPVPSAAAEIRTDIWIALCAWTFVVAQVVGYMLV